MGKTPDQYRKLSMHYATGVIGRKDKKLDKPSWNYAKHETDTKRFTKQIHIVPWSNV
jgi:hypothetical protein